MQASKETLEKITGLRMPRMKKVNAEDVKNAGYHYNSFINPTWIPGRYNHLKLPRKPFAENNVLQLPVSVTPALRIPLFWLAFKNFPYPVYLQLALRTLRHDGYLLLYFHPWEFIDLKNYNLPGYVKRDSHQKLLAKLQRLIKDLSGEGSFCTIHEFLHDGKRRIVSLRFNLSLVVNH